MSHFASKEWDRVVPELERKGYATELDIVALTAYCELATEFYMSPTDFPSNKMTQLRLLMGDFGMTPHGRAKMPDREEAEESSPYAGM